jgi:hypothetical protein
LLRSLLSDFFGVKRLLLLSLLGLEVVEVLVDGEFEHVVEHAGDEDFEDLGALLDAGVRVHLDQPRVEVLVQDEVVPEQLETPSPLLRVQDLPRG